MGDDFIDTSDEHEVTILKYDYDMDNTKEKHSIIRTIQNVGLLLVRYLRRYVLQYYVMYIGNDSIGAYVSL